MVGFTFNYTGDARSTNSVTNWHCSYVERLRLMMTGSYRPILLKKSALVSTAEKVRI